MGIPWRLRQAFTVIAIVLSIAALAPREAAAAGCAGSSHTMALSEGTVSPGSGSTAATFTFTVVYTDNGGCSPDTIVVEIAGIGAFALSHLGGDPNAGATYGRGMTLPAGARTYSFQASSGTGPGTRSATLTDVQPPKVVVVAPTPRPTVRPTPAPTIKPTPTAPATPAPAASTGAPTESPGESPSEPPTVPSQPIATSAQALAGPVDSPRPGSGAGAGAAPGTASSTGESWDRSVPRPVLALLVSTIGTCFGLVLFGVLAHWLVGTRPRFEVGAARHHRRPADPAERGSGR